MLAPDVVSAQPDEPLPGHSTARREHVCQAAGTRGLRWLRISFSQPSSYSLPQKLHVKPLFD